MDWRIPRHFAAGAACAGCITIASRRSIAHAWWQMNPAVVDESFWFAVRRGEHMGRHTVAVGILLMMGAAPAAQSHRLMYPGLIALPTGFGPEGIAVGNGSTFYAGA